MHKYSEKVMEQEWIVYGGRVMVYSGQFTVDVHSGRFTIQYKNKKALREFQESFSLV